ncbi:MAG: transposase [Flavobacteriales bacterium]|nr:transposase [Flavobacteriales bacterium]
MKKITTGISRVEQKNWGRHFWAIGYGCWSTGNITDEMVNDYLEHHRKPDDTEGANFILE